MPIHSTEQHTLAALADATARLSQARADEQRHIMHARSLNISWARIGRIVGRSRQSLQTQYVDSQPGWSSLEHPQLIQTNSDASLHIHAPSATATFHLTTPTGSHTYNARTRVWDGPRDDPALQDGLRDHLQTVAARGQQTAKNRKAGIIKRLKKIEEDGIKIGRPRKR